MYKPDLIETVNSGCEELIAKLLLLDASDSSYPHWLRTAAINLCLTKENKELYLRLNRRHDLVTAVTYGFEEVEDILDCMSEADRNRIKYSQARFVHIFGGYRYERKSVEVRRDAILNASKKAFVKARTTAKKAEVMAGGKEEVKCAICQQTFNRPNILPCSHVFYIHCSEKTGRMTNKNSGDMMPCERCGLELTLPKEGFDSLENFEAVKKTIETAQVLNPSSISDICEACAEDYATGTSSTVTYCVDGEEKLCGKRRRYHKKNKQQKKHKMQEELQIVPAGSAQLTTKSKTARNQLDPVFIRTIRINAAEEKNKSIYGLAILDKELFVVIWKSSEVEVYDSIKLSFTRRWNLKELVKPQDIRSCNRNKCLYIFDYKGLYQSKEILKVDPNGKLIKKWSTGNDTGWGLSVTDESNIILTVFNKHKLNEYSPDGQLIREINLSSDAGIRHPFHAIKLTNGHFVVSHGASGDDLHRVCIVDADGKLKKSFGGKCGSTATERMNDPVYMSVGGNGFVMVVDRWNSRLLLLDSELNFKREILSKEMHRLIAPQRILFDESYGRRLFVADNKKNEGKILIFPVEINEIEQ